MFALMVGILDVWLGVSFRGSVLLMAVSADTADRRLPDDRLPDATAGPQPGARPQPDRHHRLAGFRLCRRRISRSSRCSAFPRAWGAILPLRWYIQILFDQASRGAPLRETAEPFAILCAITAGSRAAGLAAFPRARSGAASRLPPKTNAPPASRQPGVAGAFAAEWRRVLRDRGVLGLFVLAPVLYSVFYPQPYLGQIVRNIPIAVVDQDNTRA